MYLRIERVLISWTINLWHDKFMFLKVLHFKVTAPKKLGHFTSQSQKDFYLKNGLAFLVEIEYLEARMTRASSAGRSAAMLAAAFGSIFKLIQLSKRTIPFGRSSILREA